MPTMRCSLSFQPEAQRTGALVRPAQGPGALALACTPELPRKRCFRIPPTQLWCRDRRCGEAAVRPLPALVPHVQGRLPRSSRHRRAAALRRQRETAPPSPVPVRDRYQHQHQHQWRWCRCRRRRSLRSPRQSCAKAPPVKAWRRTCNSLARKRWRCRQRAPLWPSQLHHAWRTCERRSLLRSRPVKLWTWL
jgi:hypothetical protein